MRSDNNPEKNEQSYKLFLSTRNSHYTQDLTDDEITLTLGGNSRPRETFATVSRETVRTQTPDP